MPAKPRKAEGKEALVPRDESDGWWVGVGAQGRVGSVGRKEGK